MIEVGRADHGVAAAAEHPRIVLVRHDEEHVAWLHGLHRSSTWPEPLLGHWRPHDCPRGDAASTRVSRMASTRIAHNGTFLDRSGEGNARADGKHIPSVALDAQRHAADVDPVVDDVAEERGLRDGALD